MNTESYRDAFLEEAVENIGNLNRALLAFEKETGDLTPVNELFRAAHTLKGMSATMGYDRMAEFTHMLEEVLDKVRAGTLAASRGVIDVLFNSIDVLQEFTETIRNSGVDSAAGAKKLIEKLKNASSGSAAAAPAPAKAQPKPAEPEKEPASAPAKPFNIDPSVVEAAAKQGLKTYAITVNIAKTCAFKSVRAFMVSRNLSEKGEIVMSDPPAKDIEEGKFENIIRLGYVSGAAQAEIASMITRIAEIESAAVDEVKPAQQAAAGPGEKEETDHEAPQDQKQPEKKAAAVSQSVRVNIEKLDSMMNLVGELVITKIRLDQIMKTKKYEQLQGTVQEFDRIIDSLQIEVTDVRMLPVSHIFDRYPRIVRDLAARAGKQIECEIIGGDIEIDRTVLEEINEPILHLVRNSVAHGIEMPDVRSRAGKNPKGIIRLSARRDRNSVIIEVSDDGKGIDTAKVRKKAIERNIMPLEKINTLTEEELVAIISLPGFSTAEKVDSVSGRGVGVDVVKTKVEAFGGLFRIENYPGEGMKSILKLPLTLAIIQALLVKTAGGTYAIPVIHTIETVEFPAKELKELQGKKIIVLRDEVVPVLSLSTLLGKERTGKDILNLVIIEARDKKVALEVDEVMGQQEIAIKSLGDFLKYAKGFSGVTILGDGSISLIVDVQSLIESNIKLI